jgi:hypothetical protein
LQQLVHIEALDGSPAVKVVSDTREVTFLRSLRLLIVIGTVGGWACRGASTTPSSPLPAGLWGADHVAMTVADAATHLELDCAHGDITVAITVDARGQFDVPGAFVREHGGPIRQDEVLDSHPARYSGSVAKTTMVLTIRLADSNEMIGTFTLVRGSPGRILKCL